MFLYLLEFVAACKVVSYVAYCDDVVMLTFCRQTLAASKDAERSALLAEQNKLRARVRELEKSVEQLKLRVAEEDNLKARWYTAYGLLRTSYDKLRSSLSSASSLEEPHSPRGTPLPTSRGITLPSEAPLSGHSFA